MSDAGPPVLRVITGDATAEEIAAVVAAVAVAAAPPARPVRRPVRGVGGWADRSALLRGPVRPGPDGWRASGRPG